jgi:predicted phage terminase large subunit-like protein
VKGGWHVLEPGTDFVDGWHIQEVCHHLEAVYRHEIDDLLINIPPACMKSLLVNVFFMTWVWAKRPSDRFAFWSYDDGLSHRDAEKCRRLILSPWYQARWGHKFSLSGSVNAKERFQNSETGERIATSIGGMGTGEGGNWICLPYESPITTDHGPMPIGRIVEERLPVKVLAWDHDRDCAAWRPIERYETNPGRPCVRICLSDGRILDATEDHPVYTVGRGYIPASAVKAGDRVLAHEGRATLRAMWHRLLDEARAGASAVLLQALPMPMGACASAPHGSVRLLRDFDRHPAPSQGQAELLLKALRQYRASHLHRRCQESALRAWVGGGALLSRLSGAGAADPGTGWTSLPPLRDDPRGARQGAGCPSHRLRQGPGHTGEPDYTLPLVPRPDARRAGKPPSVGELSVVSVGRIPAPDRVFNLSVAVDHNYFANGVLTHNCVDDPHKADTARSVAKRRGVLNWWTETMSTRQRPPGSGGRIIIMQRLHTMDLAGYVIKDGGWHHLCLPMEYDPKHPQCSPKDRRKKRGDLLWPKMFGPKEVAKLKKGLKTEYARAGQLQQKPVPDGGGIIKENWWRLWDDDRIPKCDIRLMSVDTGFTEKTHNDPSAYTIWGRFRDEKGQINLLLLHAWTDWLDTPDLNDKLEKVALKWKPTRILVENKAAGLPVIQEMRRRLPLWSITAFDPTQYGDKIARAYAVQELIKGPSEKGGDGIMWVPDRAWAAAMIDQCKDFPNGDHDDLVDTVTQALLHLRKAAVIVTPDEPDEEMLRAMDPEATKPKPLYGDVHS